MIPAGRCGTLLLAAACGTASVAAAGCGGGASSSACRPEAGAPPTRNPRPRGVVQRAAARTLAAGSSRFFTQTHGGSVDFTVTASGRFDFRRSRGLLSYAIGETRAGGHTYGGYAPAAIEYRLVGNCEYFRTSQGSANASKPWSSIDLSQLGGRVGVGFTGPDPGQSLAALARAGGFERTGSGRVHGVETVRYRATRGRTSVWVDGSGRVRRVTTTLRPKGSDAPLTQTTEFYGFGVPVVVGVPPPDQVQDVTDEFKSQLS